MAVSFNLPDPYEAQKSEIARRQKYAEALQQQAFQPIETSSYQGIQAPIPTTAVLAKMLAGLGGGLMSAQAAREQRELRESDIAKGQQFAQALQGAKTPEERQAIALRAMGGEFGQRAQTIGAGEYQMAETRGQKEAERALRAEQAEANRVARAEQAQQNLDLRRELAAGAQATREAQIAQTGQIAQMRAETAAAAERGRAEREEMKLPPNVATTYQEARLNERSFGDTAAKMQTHFDRIEKGELPLGVANVAAYRARNATGFSSSESSNFFEMMRDVDQTVNAIMQAAKGTQTEGDAVRARNQILSNPNDEQNVKRALADIARSSQEIQNIYRGTLNQLGGRYKGLEHERLPEVKVTKPGAPTAPTPGAGAAAPQARGAAPATGQPQFTEGQTARNPTTGERIVLKNGKWEPLR